MEWKQIEGQWKTVKGQARKQWDKLSDAELEQIAGSRERLLGKIRERYSLSPQDAERQVHQFEESLTATTKR